MSSRWVASLFARFYARSTAGRRSLRAVAPLVGALAAWGACGSSSAADEPAPPVQIKKAAAPPRIDGVLDDPVWQQAAPTVVQYAWGKVGQQAEKPKMLARFAWDDQYLYVAYETFDENLVALGTGEKEGPAANQREGAKIHDPKEPVDVVEFFVSLGDDNFFWELHHNAANQFNDVWCAVVDEKTAPVAKTTMARFGIYFGNREFMNDDPDAGVSFAKATTLKPRPEGGLSTVNVATDKDAGYFGELRLPWAGLGAHSARESWITQEPQTPGGPKLRKHGPWKMAGAELKIFSVVQDGDLKDRYHHPSPTFPGGWFHRGTPHWLRYVLGE